MAYTNQTDILNHLPKEYVTQLTDDANTDEIDPEKMADCIRHADDYIDGHLRGRYALPLDPANIPPMIRDISIKLTIYHLFGRSLILTLPEPIKEDFKWCKDTLEKIQRGKVNPFPFQSDEPVFFATNKTSGDQVFVSAPANNPSWVPSTAVSAPIPSGKQISWGGYII